MIYSESKLNVSDNSGAKRAKCVKVLKFSKSSGAKAASLVIVSIRKIKANKNVIKGQICKGILIRGKKNMQRDTGLSIKFSEQVEKIKIIENNLQRHSKSISEVSNQVENQVEIIGNQFLIDTFY